MRILGKPHKMIRGIETSPVYRAAYRACVHAGQCRTEATAKEYGKIAKYGLDNPTKTKVLIETAKRDYYNDIVSLSKNNMTEIGKRQYNTVKTNIMLKFNSLYRKSKKALNEALKEQHPDSYKLREKLIQKGNVTIKNETKPFARLGRLNINPLNI